MNKQIPFPVLARKILREAPELNISETSLIQVLQDVMRDYKEMPTYIQDYKYIYRDTDALGHINQFAQDVQDNPICPFCGGKSMGYIGRTGHGELLHFAVCNICHYTERL